MPPDLYHSSMGGEDDISIFLIPKRTMNRSENRTTTDARALKITPHFTGQAAGSVLIETGQTRVICTASVEERVPGFLKGKGQGWVTAEYSMLPGATNTRVGRDRLKVSGRTMEIQRLIGRSLRSVIDLESLGERTVTLDCDVIQADGGTRTASITGAYVALGLAIESMKKKGIEFSGPVLTGQVAAISLGIVEGEVCLDLDYVEDSSAQVDMNVVMTADQKIVEVQGTAEKEPFTTLQMIEMMNLATQGLEGHFAAQAKILKENQG